MRANTVEVNADTFRQVYDSPASLPGKFKWLTSDADVRRIEAELGMEKSAIGAPLWVSGNEKKCRHCGREVNWLDIIKSAAGSVHAKVLLVKVILGDKKFVNTEVPEAIQGVRCFQCDTPFTGLTSFKCHNWAYAFGDLAKVVDAMQKAS